MREFIQEKALGPLKESFNDVYESITGESITNQDPLKTQRFTEATTDELGKPLKK